MHGGHTIADIAINVPPVRAPDPSMGRVLGDIDSHLRRGHPYADRDRITHAHETTHGINSKVRNAQVRAACGCNSNVRDDNASGCCSGLGKYFGGDSHATLATPVGSATPVIIPRAMVNAFYVCEDRAVVLPEPTTTITAVARNVPRELRGDVYNLYLVRSVRDWDDRPLYLFDEWSAYANGARTRADLKIKDRGETVQYMWEFVVYSLTVAMTAGLDTPGSATHTFLTWHGQQCRMLYQDNEANGNTNKTRAYLGKLAAYIAPGKTTAFGTFVEKYLGTLWADQVLRGKPVIGMASP